MALIIYLYSIHIYTHVYAYSHKKSQSHEFKIEKKKKQAERFTAIHPYLFYIVNRLCALNSRRKNTPIKPNRLDEMVCECVIYDIIHRICWRSINRSLFSLFTFYLFPISNNHSPLPLPLSATTFLSRYFSVFLLLFCLFVVAPCTKTWHWMEHYAFQIQLIFNLKKIISSQTVPCTCQFFLNITVKIKHGFHPTNRPPHVKTSVVDDSDSIGLDVLFSMWHIACGNFIFKNLLNLK